MKNINIMIVGVGGQGSLLASKLLGKLFADEGYDVKVSEVHGMSQRGGSVVTYVRCGEKVYSPIVTKGEADFIVSFEKLEAARYTECLKKGGVRRVPRDRCVDRKVALPAGDPETGNAVKTDRYAEVGEDLFGDAKIGEAFRLSR